MHGARTQRRDIINATATTRGTETAVDCVTPACDETAPVAGAACCLDPAPELLTYIIIPAVNNAQMNVASWSVFNYMQIALNVAVTLHLPC
jgi:hypothetical protein